MALAKKRTPSKKHVGKKVAGSTTAHPAKKVARKSTAAAPAKRVGKKVAKKSTSPRKVAGRKHNIEYGNMNVHGFTVGSDSAILVDALIAGGPSRHEIGQATLKHLAKTTRNGTEKNVTSLMAGLVKRLEQQGYKEVTHYQLVPPARIQKKIDASA